MGTITVTNATDTPVAGELDLRQAVAEAAVGDTIVLAPDLTSGITLAAPLDISAGANITLDLGSPDSFLNPSNEITGAPIVVEANAVVTIQNGWVDVSQFGADAYPSGNNAVGAGGVAGVDGQDDTGQNGTDGGDGGNGGSATITGQSVFGAIQNFGILTLQNDFVLGYASGGSGGDGATGGDGADGGNGGTGPRGGNGGNGGSGGAGGNGSAGGDAVGGVYNASGGILTIEDSSISGTAVGGRGGNGGVGGAAANGGDGAEGSVEGGNGGSGGNSGGSGVSANGGSAVGGVLNDGTIVVIGAAMLFNDGAFAGMGGQSPDTGAGGMGGMGGDGPIQGADGNPGVPGAVGDDGDDGTATPDIQNNDVLFGSLSVGGGYFDIDAASGSASTFTGAGPYDYAYKVGIVGVSYDTLLSSVGWKVVTNTNGPSLADFVGATSGTLTFSPGEVSPTDPYPNFEELDIGVSLNFNSTEPHNESFAIELFDPSSGAVIGSSNSVTVSFVNPLAANSGIISVSGQPYASYEDFFASNGTLDGEDYFNANGSLYLSVTISTLPNGLTAESFSGGSFFDGVSYDAYEYDFSGANLVASKFFYANVPAGANYTSYEYDFDGGNNVTRIDFTGVTGAPYSSYEYDYIGGSYAGAKFEFTSVPTGASYSSYEIDYDNNNTFAGDKIFFTGISGAPYSAEEEDFDPAGQLSRALLTGFSGTPYSSLELDYDAGTYEGYKAFYAITGQPYTSEEVDVNTSNQIVKAVYSGLTTTPYSSVEEDFSNGALTSTTYDFTTPAAGQDFYAYQAVENASGAPLQEVVDNNNGSHTIAGYQDNQTFTSIGDDTFTGGGANETFVFAPVFGHDTITDFASHLSGPGNDTISLSTSEFANFAAVLANTQDVNGSAVITSPNGDTITLDSVTTAMLSANRGDVTFHA